MAHCGKSLIYIFQEFFAMIGKIFILVGGMRTGVSFYRVWKLSWYFLISSVVRELVRQLVYTMFIGNNRASFHLWWKENLVKHQKVLKYYENDCRHIMGICMSTYFRRVLRDYFRNILQVFLKHSARENSVS